MKSYKITAFKFSHEIGLVCFVVLFSDISGTEITHCLLNVVLYIRSLFYNYLYFILANFVQITTLSNQVLKNHCKAN